MAESGKVKETVVLAAVAQQLLAKLVERNLLSPEDAEAMVADACADVEEGEKFLAKLVSNAGGT